MTPDVEREPTPPEAPASPRWLQLLLRYLTTAFDFFAITFREFAADRLVLRAMALTFGTLLSLVPLLAILFSLFKLLGGGEWFNDVVRPGLMNLLAPGVESAVSDRLTHLIEGFAAKTIGGVGVALLILGVHSIFVAVEMTFNLIWGGAPRGRLLVRAPIYWGLLFVIPFLIAASIFVTTYITALPAAQQIGLLEAFLRRLIPWLMVTTGFLLTYRFLPTAPVKWSAAAAGAIAAGVIYEAMKGGFIFYARELVRYDVLYGSLAIIPLLLIWINLAWLTTLFGVEISYVYQHFDQLRRNVKHLPLSRQQQDTLGWLLVRSALRAWESSSPWVNASKLSEQWQIPAGATSEIVSRLERGGVFLRKGEAGDVIRLAGRPDTLTFQAVDRALRHQRTGEWFKPLAPEWMETAEWLTSRERRGEGENLSLERLDEIILQRSWKPRGASAEISRDGGNGTPA